MKDVYPLPRIDESLESMKDAKYFSSLDLAQGYLQVAMSEKDKQKTAFRVGNGDLDLFHRMAFDLCSTPQSFRRLMKPVLGDPTCSCLP